MEGEAEAEAEAEKNWSEKVEDLVDAGDTDAAISLLESLILKLQTSDSNPQLASALLELSKLYDAINLRSVSPFPNSSLQESSISTHNNIPRSTSTKDESANDGNSDVCAKSSTEYVAPQGSSDDDWEAIADRAPDELLSPKCLPEVSKLSLHDTEAKKVPNRRGRGTFTYKKQGFYSDEQLNDSIACDASDDIVHDKSGNFPEAKNLYGTHHALVLDGFHPSNTTTDLERLFEDFRDRGFAIRWVNDTLALAVFRTPSIAAEAHNSVHCSFKVRVLEEDDSIMSYISVKEGAGK